MSTDDPCRAREGTEGSICDALSQAAGDAALLLAGSATEGAGCSKGISRASQSAEARSNLPVRRLDASLALASRTALIRCGTPSPCICWNPEPISARFNCCLATAAWQPRPATSASPPARYAPLPARSTCCLILSALTPSPLHLSIFERQGHGSSETGSGGWLPLLRRSVSGKAW